MAKSRDASLIVAQDLQDALGQLNFILQRINDRIDKLEGLRDEPDPDSGASFSGSVAADEFAVSDESHDTVLHSLGTSE